VRRTRAARERRNEAALRAYIETGTIKAAAHRLGLSEAGVRKRLADYCADHGYASVVQAAYWFGRPEAESHFATLERGIAQPF